MPVSAMPRRHCLLMPISSIAEMPLRDSDIRRAVAEESRSRRAEMPKRQDFYLVFRFRAAVLLFS
jgi:hypothetical protein